jgi:hypothetical protein
LTHLTALIRDHPAIIRQTSGRDEIDGALKLSRRAALRAQVGIELVGATKSHGMRRQRHSKTSEAAVQREHLFDSYRPTVLILLKSTETASSPKGSTKARAERILELRGNHQ